MITMYIFPVFYFTWLCGHLTLLFKCLVYFCTPEFLWLSSFLYFSPSRLRVPHALLCPQCLAEYMPQSFCPFPCIHCLAHGIILITRYHAENRNVTFGEYKFGPLFMRLCYELDLEESAVELIKDQVIVSWLLSLSMWFPCAEHGVFLVMLTKASLFRTYSWVRFSEQGCWAEGISVDLHFKVSLESLLWKGLGVLIQRCRTGAEELYVQIVLGVTWYWPPLWEAFSGQ